MTLTRRTLGSTANATSLDVTAEGFGCMLLTDYYEKADPSESEATLRHAFDLGVTFFDTADIYAKGANEELVGKVLANVRESVVIATKFGFDVTGSGREIDGRPEYVRAAAEASLRRLNTDYIDVLYAHRVDPEVPIEDTMGAIAELVSEGKVRYAGLCEAGATTIRRAHAVHPLVAVQSEYSLFARDVEAEVLPALSELGIGFVPFSPLGRGILTGQIKSAADIKEGDVRLSHERFRGDALQANLTLVGALEEFAAQRDLTPAQIALAWVLEQGQSIVPIPGTRRVGHLESNLRALEVELTQEEVTKLTQIVPSTLVKGKRHPSMHLLNI